MKPVFRANLFALLIVILQIVIGIIFGIFGVIEKIGYTNIMIVDEYMFLLLPVIIYMLITKSPIRQTFRLNKISLKDVGIVILIAFLSQPVAAFLSALTSLFFNNPVDEAFDIIGNIPFWLQIFMIAITPAVCEEAVTRGVILSNYEEVTMWKAAVMNGLIFGILHLSGQQFLYAFALGVVFSYLVKITNSIFASAICHFTFNGIQVTLAKIQMMVQSGTTDKQSVNTPISFHEQLITIVVLFVFAAMFTALIVMLVKYLQKEHSNKTIQPTNFIEKFEENSEVAYLFRESANEMAAEERVINLPFIILSIIYVIWIVMELMSALR